ncbi:hypothetical protein PINS_up010557 [Pythium insidiosum]|nr:hypothetical protein PINS_up010557 [Pythium insidiosum]
MNPIHAINNDENAATPALPIFAPLPPGPPPNDTSFAAPAPPPLPLGPPPPMPAPQEVRLRELFEAQDTSAAASRLATLEEGHARDEIIDAFATVPSAPSALLLALVHWHEHGCNGYQSTPSSQPTPEKLLSLISVAMHCISQVGLPLTLSAATSDLAGLLLVTTMLECRVSFVESFIRAFAIPPAKVEAYGMLLLRRRPSQAVRLLENLGMPARLPFKSVLQCALETNDLAAADIYVRQSPEQQREFIEFLIDNCVPDKVIRKRITTFKLREDDFPAYKVKYVECDWLSMMGS